MVVEGWFIDDVELVDVFYMIINEVGFFMVNGVVSGQFINEILVVNNIIVLMIILDNGDVFEVFMVIVK